MRAIIGIGLICAVGAALGQTPAPAPAFEVASIKPAAPIVPGQAAMGKLHVGMKIDAARVDIGFLSLADLIPVAFRVKPYQVLGPDWMRAQRFDIQATMPEGATKDQVPEMLQALLAERFKLAFHRETKEHAVYALLVGKKGLKLKESPPDADAPAQGTTNGETNGDVHVSRSGDGKGMVVTGGKAGPVRMSMNAGMMHLEAAKMSMATLADTLSRFVDRPIVDMTELKGNYQVALDVSIEDLRNMAKAAGMMPAGAMAGGDAARTPANAASDPSGSSIFASVQELGLRLEPRKAPMELIVVDHLEKTPTEN